MSPRCAARTTRPGDVVDAHVHLFARRLLEEYLEHHPDPPQRLRDALEKGRLGRRSWEIPELEPDEMAEWFVRALDEAGVRKAVMVSVFPDSEYTRSFLDATSGVVCGLTNVDPRDPGAPDLLEREMAFGYRGVKLLPVNRCYRLSDPACRPFFSKAAELGAAITVHYGVTVDPTGDLRYADPIDLSPVARDFPDITFVIAHFGAGYLAEVLRLAYQCENVCVDTSGTNNWLDYSIPCMSLADVFERCITALGPERVLFGTDSNPMAGRYRRWIKHQQLRILDELGLTERDNDLIVRGNAVRVFRLEETS